MSHFAVLVIGENPEEQLAPYQENNMGDCPKKYLKFVDQEEEMKAEYETGSDYNSKPFKEAFPSFEHFAKEYHGITKDEETGKYGYYENPNAKWDWYLLGGRWTGFFRLKPKADGKRGEPGIMTKPAKVGYADQTRKGDVDIEGMMDEAGIKARDNYRKVAVLFGGEIPKIEKTWAEFMKDETIPGVEEKRTQYWAQPAMAKLEEIRKSNLKGDDRSLAVWLDLEKYQVTEEQYVQDARDNALVTFAVLKDGKWYERGKMGWWATVTNEKEDEEWKGEFSSILKNLPDDTILSVYD